MLPQHPGFATKLISD